MSTTRTNNFIPEGSRLAFDENIPPKTIGHYAKRGNVIVYCAQPGMTDEDWVSEAFARGADVCVSSDSDVGNIIERCGYDGMKWRMP